MEFKPTTGNQDQTVESLRLAFEAGEGQLIKQDVNGVPLLFSPSATKITDLQAIVDLYRDAPRRVQAQQQFLTVESFGAYLIRFGAAKGDFPALLKGSIKGLSVTATLDYHTSESPEWCEHAAILVSQRTPEWAAFTQANGKFVSQTDFAIFIERYSAWIETPDPATLAKTVESLEGSSGGKWESKYNRTNGSFKFTVQEETTTNVTVPDRMGLEIAPFYHSPSQAVAVRIQFKLEAGSPMFALVIDNAEKIEYDALLATFEQVKMTTGLTVLVGP